MVVIVIISAVLAGLICLGMFLWLVWRNKRKLKGEIFIFVVPIFFYKMIEKNVTVNCFSDINLCIYFI